MVSVLHFNKPDYIWSIQKIMCQIYWQKTSLETDLQLNTFKTAHSKSSILCVLPRLVRISVGRDISVGIANRYCLSGTGIEYRWEREFPHPSIPDLRPTHTMGNGSFPGVKWVGLALTTHNI